MNPLLLIGIVATVIALLTGTGYTVMSVRDLDRRVEALEESRAAGGLAPPPAPGVPPATQPPSTGADPNQQRMMAKMAKMYEESEREHRRELRARTDAFLSGDGAKARLKEARMRVESTPGLDPKSKDKFGEHLESGQKAILAIARGSRGKDLDTRYKAIERLQEECRDLEETVRELAGSPIGKDVARSFLASECEGAESALLAE